MRQRRIQKALISVFVAVICSILISCGPIKATMAIQDVEDRLSEARELQADQKVASAYYYWVAHEYLSKAKRTHGYSDFIDSQEFAAKAEQFADKAVKKAKKGKKLVKEPKLPEPTEE